MGWRMQITEVRYPDLPLIPQAHHLDDAHGYATEHHIAFYSCECLYYMLLLVPVLYLGEGIISTFPTITVRPRDCVYTEMIEKTSNVLFHLPEHDRYLKMAGVSCYDILCGYGQVCTYKDGMCLLILYKDKLQGLAQPFAP